MKLKIIKQEKNPFLEREELTLEITSEAAPSAAEVMAELGKDEALTVIKKINTNFGRQTFLTQVVVYDNIEARKKVETIPQKVRKKMAAEEAEAAKKKAAEEAAAAETAKTEAEAAKAEAEKPAEEEKPTEEETKEEVKEETKEEEKKE